MPNKRPSKTKWGETTVKDCTKEVTSPIVELGRWHKVDYSNPAALESRINEFFDFCIANNLKPSVELLVSALGVSRQTLYRWADMPGWRGQLITDAKNTINAILSEMALNNMVNPTTVIWFQKNHEGYQDNVKIETEQTTPLDGLPSREDILKRLPKEEDDKIEDAEYKEIEKEEEPVEEPVIEEEEEDDYDESLYEELDEDDEFNMERIQREHEEWFGEI